MNNQVVIKTFCDSILNAIQSNSPFLRCAIAYKTQTWSKDIFGGEGVDSRTMLSLLLVGCLKYYSWGSCGNAAGTSYHDTVRYFGISL